MSLPILEVRDLKISYAGNFTLQVPSLAVREREILAIMGPNGSGKSTLLRVLSLLEAPMEGEVFFEGQKVDFSSPDLLSLRRRIAVVFQEPLLLDTTVSKNVALGLRLRGIRGEREKVRWWLDRLGIAHLQDRPARTLSGGEAQRVSLARAFVLDPDVLLLDEPFAALDLPTREALLADLRGILSETRTTTVFVTHDRDEALALGDRVAVMTRGKILQLDPPEVVFSSPADPEVARFVGVETILPGRVISAEEGLVVAEIDGRKIEVAGEASPGERVLVCVRPEDIALTKVETAPSSVRNSLEGRVKRAIPFGFSFRIVLDCGFELAAVVTPEARRELGLEPGRSVVAVVKAPAVHCIPRSAPPVAW
ncbi:MAG: ABC transporter ATP-binding protein, partial [Candidatus Methylomirabilales bacterium]